MSEAQQLGGGAESDFDLTQFYQVFFEEAAENLDLMEQMLLSLHLETADDEELNGIFRCAHSVKGGAATFGFADVAGLTHQMESLLDRLWRHEIQPNSAMVDVLLQSADVSRSLLARHQAGGIGDLPSTEALVQRISELALGDGQNSAPTGALATAPLVRAVQPELQPMAVVGERTLEILVGPLKDRAQGEAIQELFRDIPGLGTIEALACDQADMQKYAVVSSTSSDELLDLFEFHVSRSQVVIKDVTKTWPETPTDLADAVDVFRATQLQPGTMALDDPPPGTPLAPSPGFGFFDGAPGAPMAPPAHVTSAAEKPASQGKTVEKSVAPLAQAEAATLGKKVEFVTMGESTELDKGLVEKITDPLTHLVRNSCDHGVEMPEERVRAGKPEAGTITLSAAHQGGSIVIEVRDDGRGMSREKILKKARERGLEVSDQMPDADVWQLIFAPGFSTAEVVTDVSGRGVGMDVVKRNITALNGTVEIDSAEGYGMRVSVRLPLTLAIMDGMSVGVGKEVYMLPLSSVIESFQVKADAINTVGQGAQLVKVRDEYMPVVELERVFQIPRADRDRTSDIMVVIESEGSRVALLVDDLLGQQQVVVKNLESNYRKIPNVSGATILGDGKVALILDTGALVRRSRH
ncbi:MAG: chemotaxis protein CheW [Burkholderiales bacterium]|nr:chemotaxis protein CheW [Burkholderiales bacterium]